MSITTVTSRELNQDVSGAKKAAQDGPVFITDRGKPAHVLMTMDDYRRLAGGQQKIANLLALTGVEATELKIPKFTDHAKPADLA